MIKNYRRLLMVLMLIAFSEIIYAQNDVTKFLGIPVDGYKPEMIKKLKDKGFRESLNNKDVLVGEFNGVDVNIHVVTNSNKVYRIMVSDANSRNEADIRIRFNNLLQQFQNNKNYITEPDSTIKKYSISEEEDISYGMSVKNKRYEAVFYQKTASYDSLMVEKNNILTRQNSDEAGQLVDIILKSTKESIESLNKTVWFKINQFYGKYYITMYYDNEYNTANGDDL